MADGYCIGLYRSSYWSFLTSVVVNDHLEAGGSWSTDLTASGSGFQIHSPETLQKSRCWAPLISIWTLAGMKFKGSPRSARQSGFPSPEVKMSCLVGCSPPPRALSFSSKSPAVVFGRGKGGLYAQLVWELTLCFFNYQDQCFGH